jgi:hypothetical protein
MDANTTQSSLPNKKFDISAAVHPSGNPDVNSCWSGNMLFNADAAVDCHPSEWTEPAANTNENNFLSMNFRT